MSHTQKTSNIHQTTLASAACECNTPLISGSSDLIACTGMPHGSDETLLLLEEEEEEEETSTLDSTHSVILSS